MGVLCCLQATQPFWLAPIGHACASLVHNFAAVQGSCLGLGAPLHSWGVAGAAGLSGTAWHCIGPGIEVRPPPMHPGLIACDAQKRVHALKQAQPARQPWCSRPACRGATGHTEKSWQGDGGGWPSGPPTLLAPCRAQLFSSLPLLFFLFPPCTRWQGGSAAGAASPSQGTGAGSAVPPLPAGLAPGGKWGRSSSSEIHP